MNIPDNFQPQGAMGMDLFGVKFKMAVFEAGGGDGVLMLAQMQMPVQQGDQEAAIRRELAKQQHGNKELRIKRSESRDFDIRGQKVPFMFAEAEEPATGEAYRQVSGTFPGNGGTAFLMLQLKEEDYDEEAVVEMLKSIK
jgi:hypothetical protein